MASEASLRGYVLSMTGVILPASRNSRKTAIVSFLLGIEKFGLGSCFTKRERNISLKKWGMSPNMRLPAPESDCGLFEILRSDPDCVRLSFRRGGQLGGK